MLEEIKREVCEKYEISIKEIESRSRVQRIAKARQIAMYRCRKETHATLGAIGQCFNRGHAAVAHAVKINSRGFGSVLIWIFGWLLA